jgi:hypothetical protein
MGDYSQLANRIRGLATGLHSPTPPALDEPGARRLPQDPEGAPLDLGFANLDQPPWLVARLEAPSDKQEGLYGTNRGSNAARPVRYRLGHCRVCEQLEHSTKRRPANLDPPAGLCDLCSRMHQGPSPGGHPDEALGRLCGCRASTWASSKPTRLDLGLTCDLCPALSVAHASLPGRQKSLLSSLSSFRESIRKRGPGPRRTIDDPAINHEPRASEPEITFLTVDGYQLAPPCAVGTASSLRASAIARKVKPFFLILVIRFRTVPGS